LSPANRLLELLWPQGTTNKVTIWTAGRSSKRSIHLLAPTLDDTTLKTLEDRNSKGENIYFGLSSRSNELEEEFKRGTKSECRELPAIVLDIDLYSPDNPQAHAAGNLPATKEDALEILSACPHPPSFLVHTGNGIHAYWLFYTPYSIKDHRNLESNLAAFQTAFILKAKEKGWHLDHTHTVDRVWRLPGFLNKKTDLPVRLLAPPDPIRYNPSELGISESKGASPLPRKSEPLPLKPQAQSSEIPSSLLTTLHNLKDEGKRSQFAALLEGSSPAPRGARDATLHAMASTLVFVDEGKTTPEALAELFRPSMRTWAAEPDSTKTEEEELAKVTEKIQRAQNDFFQKQAKESESLDAIRLAFMTGAEETDSNPPQVSPRHFIIQRDAAYYPFDFTTLAYDRARSQQELYPVLRDAWEGSAAELYRMNEKGEMKLRSVSDITLEHCTVANDIIYDMSADRTFYDPRNRTLFARAAILRNLEPQFHPTIDQWLRALPADPQDVDLLLDWIAGVSEVKHQCSAIYLSGPKDVGKSLLAHGLSMLWLSEAPSKMEHIVCRFNSSLLDCPLIVLDEQWSNKKINICGEIRELVGTTSHRVEQKGLTPVTVKGAVRIMITANNDAVLSTEGNGDMTENDRAATAERILHIECSTKATQILKKETNRFFWITNCDIARHALWLRQERFDNILEDRNKSGRRYLVQGRYKKEFHDGIGQKQDDFYAVAEVLVSAVLNPKGPFGAGKISRVYKDEFRVTSKGVLDSWQPYLGDRYDMPKNNVTIGKILSQMGTRVFDKTLGANVYRIQKEYLCEQAEKLELATPEQVVAGLKNKVFALGDDNG
jgi:hypothetical protein